MKLLLVSVKSEKSRGGIAVWTERYLSRCAAHGIDCTLVNTEIVGKRAQQGTAKRSLADEFVRTRRIFKDLGKCLKTEFDAAHLNTSCGTFGLFRDYFIARKIKKKGIPLVTHYHCDIPYWIRNRLSRWCLGKLVRLSDENIVLCANSQRFLKAQYGASSRHIPNFVEESLVRTDEKPIRPVISHALFVGRVEQAKGAKELFAAAAQLPHIRFDLVGSVCDTVSDWEKPENVHLLGSVPNEQVIRFLDETDIFLLPSHTEGCSMALMEAMARGVPSVATDVGANADMLSGGCGIVVRRESAGAIVKAIGDLAPADLRREMSANTVGKIRAHYTDRNVKALIEIISKCCSR